MTATSGTPHGPDDVTDEDVRRVETEYRQAFNFARRSQRPGEVRISAMRSALAYYELRAARRLTAERERDAARSKYLAACSVIAGNHEALRVRRDCHTACACVYCETFRAARPATDTMDRPLDEVAALPEPLPAPSHAHGARGCGGGSDAP